MSKTAKSVGEEAGRNTGTHRRRPLKSSADQQSLQTLSRISAEISHDMNNHLSVALNYTFILLRHLDKDSPLREHVEQLQLATWRASRVTQQLQGFGRRGQPDATQLDVNSIIVGAHPLLQHILGPEIALETRLDSALPNVYIPLIHVEQLLWDTAIKTHSMLAEGGMLSIATRSLEVTEETSSSVGNFVLLTMTQSVEGSAQVQPSSPPPPVFIDAKLEEQENPRLVQRIAEQANCHFELTHDARGCATLQIWLPTGK